MDSAPLDPTDLQQALDGRFPYHLLTASLQQRLSQQEYHAFTVKYSILRWHAYHRLPDFVKPTLSEGAYYETMIQYGGEQLQLYPYAHQKQILFYTRETPLSYYVRMIGEMLKAERSYDRLPNFTANDILNLLGVGRNQYLNTTKEVRSKLRWHVNRSYVAEHLPNELLPSAALDPFWTIVPVLEPPAQQSQQLERVNKLCRGHPEDAALFRLLVTRGAGPSAASFAGAGAPSGAPPTTTTASFALSSSFAKASSADQHLLDKMQVDRCLFASDVLYACQAPYESVQRLYRKALICADFTVSADDLVVVPPLGNFVMNRTSEEPLELLLYRVLSTLDDRTPLQLLAQLLMVAEEDVCAAVHALIRLGLARKKHVRVPPSLVRRPGDGGGASSGVHPSWQAAVDALTATRRRQPSSLDDHSTGAASCRLRLGAESTAAAATAASRSGTGLPADTNGCGDPCPAGRVADTATHAGGEEIGEAPPSKRIALLYDATLTGFLMMTNLSRDPVFKQHAVTLFEVGKMPDELVDSFLALLERVEPSESRGFGGEAQKYINSVVSLRELLRVLRGVPCPDGGGPSGVDMLKIESLNELEATTRYSVLGRNYWAYVATAPIATAPFIDVELSCVYGNTASLMASPWLLLFLYDKLRRGPPTMMLPFGSQLYSWPPEFHDLQEAPASQSPADGGVCVEGYAAKVRMQSITLDAEVSLAEMDTSLVLVNETAATAPVVVQCVAPLPLVSQPRARRDGAVREQPGHGFLEVTVPFSATPEDVQELLAGRVAEDLVDDVVAPSNGGGSRDGEGDARAADATDVRGSVVFADKGAAVYEAVEACVDALRLRDSLGYITCCVRFHATAPDAASPISACLSASWGTSFAVDRVDVVGLGLGISLTQRACCTCALRTLPRLLSEEASERHNAAMRVCVEEFSSFLERYSTLTRASYGKLALRSTGVTGPMTQQHLRKVGGGGAAPFPATIIVFDGRALRVVDDANPLSEQWTT